MQYAKVGGSILIFMMLGLIQAPLPNEMADGVAKAAGAPGIYDSGLSADALYYGPGYRANGLSNFPLGDVEAHGSGYGTTGKTAFSIRFRATHTGTLSRIGVRIETVNTANNIAASYGWGTGGTIQIQLQTDDGSASHLPSGTALGSFTTPADGAYAFFNYGTAFDPTVDGGADNINTLVTLSPSVTLTAGQLYHIVLRQIAADGANNFVSVAGLYVPGAGGDPSGGSPLSPLQPIYSDTDFAGLVSVDQGPWQTTTQFWGYGCTPNMELHYTDGYIDGRFAYSYLFVNNTNTISGTSAFRELFTPSVNVTAKTVGIYAYRVSGNDPLTVNVKDVNGNVLASASFPALSSFPAVNTRYLLSAPLSSAITLTKGQTYSIEFDCPATSTYNLDGMSDGNPASVSNIGAHTADYFSDGHAQENVAGAGWTNYTDTSTAPDGTANAHFMWYLQR